VFSSARDLRIAFFPSAFRGGLQGSMWLYFRWRRSHMVGHGPFSHIVARVVYSASEELCSLFSFCVGVSPSVHM